MRVLVCGGRDYADKLELWRALDAWDPAITEVISGMARGADAFAAEWAEEHEIPLHRFPADWDTHGKAAGPIRNQRMLDEGKPDVVVAFPGGRGTADMVRRAEAAGVKVVRVEHAAHPATA